MSDRELLELAAKAAGIDGVMTQPFTGLYVSGYGDWNPLTDDRDAFCLLARLQLEITALKELGEIRCEDYYGIYRGVAAISEDGASDYRAAIVRCAAEIGKAMP